MSHGTLCVGRCFHIPVRVHVSWLAAFALASGSLASAYFPYLYPGWPPALYAALGLVTSLLLFASILLHELAHSLVAQRRGLAVHGIVLFALGGISEISQEPPTPAVELALALAGPATSLVVGAGVGLLWYLSLSGSLVLSALLGYIGGLNLTLAIFNLIPGFPLDGGRVVRAILWQRSRNLEWATRWASRLGRAVAAGFVALGVWLAATGGILDGIWFLLVGCFLDGAARAAYHQLAIQALLAGHAVGEVRHT